MAQLFDTGKLFQNMINELVQRVQIEKQTEGWAVIVDGELITWAVSEERARDFAIRWLELG